MLAVGQEEDCGKRDAGSRARTVGKGMLAVRQGEDYGKRDTRMGMAACSRGWAQHCGMTLCSHKKYIQSSSLSSAVLLILLAGMLPFTVLGKTAVHRLMCPFSTLVKHSCNINKYCCNVSAIHRVMCPFSTLVKHSCNNNPTSTAVMLVQYTGWYTDTNMPGNFSNCFSLSGCQWKKRSFSR